MDKKKLIGTIIGVIFFIVLIAGATFAWLTFSANITNGNYNTITGNFVIDYVGAQTLDDVPILSTGTPESAAVRTVSAKLSTNSIAGKLTVKLTTNSDTLLTTSGALNYAVCTSATEASSCTTDFSQAVATGTINASGEKNLYVDPNDLTTANRYYFVYFWLDGSLITNDILETPDQNSYSGYIHASAEQSHN